MSGTRKVTATSSHNPPPVLGLNHIVQRNPEIVAAEADDDIVMVSVISGKYYGVSDIARSIWENIENPKHVYEIIDELTEIYDVEPATCEKETLLFLEDLLAEGLLQVKYD